MIVWAVLGLVAWALGAVAWWRAGRLLNRALAVSDRLDVLVREAKEARAFVEEFTPFARETEWP